MTQSGIHVVRISSRHSQIALNHDDDLAEFKAVVLLDTRHVASHKSKLFFGFCDVNSKSENYQHLQAMHKERNIAPDYTFASGKNINADYLHKCHT